MRLAVAAIALALVGACGSSDPSPPTARDLAEADLSPDHTITVDEDGYEPADLEVEAGDVVLLVNAGDEVHSFSTHEGELETGRMEPGDETTVVLRDPQVVRFHDIEAPEHEGSLTVVAQ